MSIEHGSQNNVKKWSAAGMAACLTLAMSSAPQPNMQATERTSFSKAPERSALNGILALQAQSLLLASTLRNLPGSNVKTGEFVPKAWAPGPFGFNEVTLYNPVTDTKVTVDYSTQRRDSAELVNCDDWAAGGYDEYPYMRVQTHNTGKALESITFDCATGSETISVSYKNGYASTSGGDSSNTLAVVRAAQNLYAITESLPR